MRDEKRIKRILDLVHQIWSNQPDIRFNQLLYNLQHNYIKSTEETGWKVNRQTVQVYGNKVYIEEDTYIDMFHLEDDKFEKFLKECVDK